ncbi:MAG TPA: TIM barrel protein [Gaiellaceae bacterium]|nr:TIM barrel protein [Gaiellaceae bacterium]
MKVGMAGRFFAGNWRPPADEISFAAGAGFDAIQIRSDRPGGIEDDLRTDLGLVREDLDAAGIEPVLEMLVRLDDDAREHRTGDTLAEALARNLAAIRVLGCRRVHVHPALQHPREGLERRLEPALAEAAALARANGFVLGLEHNSAEELLFARPRDCARALDAVPELGFVWDVNHTAPGDLEAFESLLPHATLVHLSDTPLPETNYHLPLGLGSVDLGGTAAALATAGFAGPVVLEIGGLPRSGGFGRDTDDALRDSRRRLLEAA